MGDSLGTRLMHVQNIYIRMYTKIAPAALLQTLSVQLLRGRTGTHVKVIKQTNCQLKHQVQNIAGGN